MTIDTAMMSQLEENVTMATALQEMTTLTLYKNASGNLSTFIESMSNMTYSPDSLGDPWNLKQKLFFGIWLSISMICSICGNLMVIIVVFRHKGMQTRTNMFLVNLAIADFLTGFLIMPFSLTTLIKGKWIFKDEMCNVNGVLVAVTLITSIQTLMWISVHKYISITRPFSRVLNHWKILLMIIGAWVWAIICAILTLVMNKVVHKHKALQCGPELPHNTREIIHHLIITITNFVIPLAIMIFAYSRMYCEFRQHAVRLQQNTTLQSDQILGQQIQVTKTLFSVLACFWICWFPYAIYSWYSAIVEDKSSVPEWANPAAYCFTFMNSGCNPVIYAWRSPSFREGYKEILCQRSGYIVSDDTIRDSDSPSIMRRLSTMLHSSFRIHRQSSRRNSEDGISLNSHMSRSASVSSPTHTLLRRATSKTAKGSSIIRKDGAVIITKNGKIISYRYDSESLKRDRSFSGFEDMKTRRRQDGVSKSFSDFNMFQNNRLEASPLLLRASDALRNSASSSVSSIPQNPQRHASLTKIDSVGEKENECNETDNQPSDDRVRNCLLPPSTLDIKSSRKFSDSRERSKSDLNLSRGSQSNSPSIRSDLDEVFDSPVVVVTHTTSQENILVNMSLEPSIKDQKRFAKSDCRLNADDSGTLKVHMPSKKAKSSDELSEPLVRYPSLERLDVPSRLPRSSSEVKSLKQIPNSPLYQRRWLSNKNLKKKDRETLKLKW